MSVIAQRGQYFIFQSLYFHQSAVAVVVVDIPEGSGREKTSFYWYSAKNIQLRILGTFFRLAFLVDVTGVSFEPVNFMNV